MKYFTWLMVCMVFIPSVLIGQVRINEVLYNVTTGQVDQIELKNFGTASVNVSTMWFCSLLNYDQIQILTVVSGSLNIPAGGFLVLSGKNLNSPAADLGFYNDIGGNFGNFGNSSFMVDFVQWGSANNGRESVAVSKGIWPDDGFVPAVAAGHSIEYDGSGNGPANWVDQPNPTFGAENGAVTGVEDEVVGTPREFRLEQNYPNPFNPSTVINYTTSPSANSTGTRLVIFNLLGQKVRTLVDARETAGSHSVTWDGRNDAGELLPSGVYIYRLTFGTLVDSKKMLFIR